MNRRILFSKEWKWDIRITLANANPANLAKTDINAKANLVNLANPVISAKASLVNPHLQNNRITR